MVELPTGIAKAVPQDARPAVERWWATLADSERQTLVGLWDERSEVYFFSPQQDDAGRLDEWEQLPNVEDGQFLPDADAIDPDEWMQDWHEYVLGHEDVVIFSRIIVAFRNFYTYQAQPEARAVTDVSCCD